MADVSISWDGDFDIIVANATLPQLEVVCIQIENAAKILCPVDTGRLRASITHEVGLEAGDAVGRVGTDVEYAPYVELGTRFMSARSFLRAAAAMIAGAA